MLGEVGRFPGATRLGLCLPCPRGASSGAPWWQGPKCSPKGRGWTHCCRAGVQPLGWVRLWVYLQGIRGCGNPAAARPLLSLTHDPPASPAPSPRRPADERGNLTLLLPFEAPGPSAPDPRRRWGPQERFAVACASRVQAGRKERDCKERRPPRRPPRPRGARLWGSQAPRAERKRPPGARHPHPARSGPGGGGARGTHPARRVGGPAFRTRPQEAVTCGAAEWLRAPGVAATSKLRRGASSARLSVPELRPACHDRPVAFQQRVPVWRGTFGLPSADAQLGCPVARPAVPGGCLAASHSRPGSPASGRALTSPSPFLIPELRARVWLRPPAGRRAGPHGSRGGYGVHIVAQTPAVLSGQRLLHRLADRQRRLQGQGGGREHHQTPG